MTSLQNKKRILLQELESLICREKNKKKNKMK
jgi:hypothetical protein